MQTRVNLLMSIFLIVALGLLAACGDVDAQSVPTAAPSPAVEAVDPAEVVLEMVARANAEDFAGAAELVSEDMMSYFIGLPPTGIETYRGRDQFQTFLEECCTGQNFVWEVKPVRVEGDTVFTESKTWMDFTRELGVAPNSWHEVFVVRDGKIDLYTSTLTQAALARFKPVLYEALPELATAVQPPVDTGETPVSEITVTFDSGICTYSGPMLLQAGELTINVSVPDQDWNKYAVSFFTLDEGKDLVDLMAATYNDGPPPWADMVFLAEFDPGANQTYTDSMEEGTLYMVCWAKTPDTAIGNAGPFVVKP